MLKNTFPTVETVGDGKNSNKTITAATKTHIQRFQPLGYSEKNAQH